MANFEAENGGKLGDVQPQLDHLLSPRRIAIVGASRSAGPGSQAILNLQQLGYSGEILPINPKYDDVLGHVCFPTLRDAVAERGPIDAVAILLGRENVVPVLEQAGKAGIPAAWAFASGFAEADARGHSLQDRLVDVCRSQGIVLCGPNCVGIASPGTSCALFSAPLPEGLKSGNITVVSQSGSIALTLINGTRQLGFRTIVSSGNEAVLDSTDYLEYFLEDDGTAVMMAFIEEFRQPERFAEIAQRAHERGKPILVLKVGRSAIAQRATQAHTGALAGADDVYDAVFRKHGVIRVRDLNEWVQTAAAFSTLENMVPYGHRVGMLTLSGGAIGLVADLAEDSELEFPPWSPAGRETLSRILPEYADLSNPLDAWGSGRIEETYETCLDVVASEPVDMVLLVQDAPAGIGREQRQQFMAVAHAAQNVRRRRALPILALSHLSGGLDPELGEAFQAAKVPLLQGTREGMQAVGHLARFGGTQRERRPLATARDYRLLFSALSAGILDEFESKRLFDQAGIPIVGERRCTDWDGVLAAAGTIGYPVVLKGLAPAFPHKSDAGLVRLNLESPNALRAAFSAMDETMKELGVASPSYLVQTMVCRSAVEMMVGMIRDPAFGAVVVLGVGGRGVEITQQKALGIPPLGREETLDLLRMLSNGRLLDHPRGLKNADVDALVGAVIRMGDLAASSPDAVASMEINPLLVLPKGEGVIAVDGLVEISEAIGTVGKGRNG
jgi:acetate---CoA ligase (ADP-forming)